MVLPEGTRESEGSRPKTLIAVGAALVLLGATVALGLATAPDAVTAQESTTTTTDDEPLHEPTTTTSIDIETFSVSDIATGERLSWREASPIAAAWPIELLEHDGRLYLFTSDRQPYPRQLSRGFQVWVSTEGIQWAKVGEVTDAAISGVTSAGGRFVAMGTDTDGSPHIWTSTDGVEWRGSELPVTVDTNLPISAWVSDAAWHKDQLIVIGSVTPDPQRAIVDRLPAEVAAHIDKYGMGLSDGPEGPSVEIYAPLGIIAYSATLEDLGVEDEIADTLFVSTPGENAYVWSSTDGDDWTVVEETGRFLQHLWTGSDGALLASGWDNVGPSVWASADGVTWERTHRSSINVAGSWNDWLVGVRNDREIVRSHNGRDWESLGTETVLPQSLEWYLEQIGIGQGGIAAIATTWTPQSDVSISQQETVLEVAGHTVTFDHNTGFLTVEGARGRAVVPLWTNNTEDDVTVDFAGESMTFLDAETGVELATVDFEDLREAELSLYGPRDVGQRALLLSSGQGEWSILDLAEEIGDGVHIAMLRVFDDQMIVITYPIDAIYGGSPPPWSLSVATLP